MSFLIASIAVETNLAETNTAEAGQLGRQQRFSESGGPTTNGFATICYSICVVEDGDPIWHISGKYNFSFIISIPNTF